MTAETNNVYECLDDLRHKTQAECRAVRHSNRRDQDTTFVNPGIDCNIREEHDYEQPLGLSHDAERTRRIRQNDLYERSGDERRTRAARNANITLGIREISANMSATSGKNSNILSNCCLMVCMIILLLASLGPAGYLYYEYEIQNDRSCLSNTESSNVYQTGISPNQTMVKELRELSNQMHTLQNELKELKSASRQPQPGSGNSRQDRRLFAQLARKTNGIEKEVKDITKNFNDKILNMDKHYNDSIIQLNSELSNMIELLKHNRSILGKCVFKMNNSFTSDRKQNQTVSIVQNDNLTLTTVTCCTEFMANFEYYNAFLTVERNNKTIYTCHCFNGQKCDICYWECSS